MRELRVGREERNARKADCSAFVTKVDNRPEEDLTFNGLLRHDAPTTVGT
jgi:hypothetical protein